jgi:hypothetical protein
MSSLEVKTYEDATVPFPKPARQLNYTEFTPSAQAETFSSQGAYDSGTLSALGWSGSKLQRQSLSPSLFILACLSSLLADPWSLGVKLCNSSPSLPEVFGWQAYLVFLYQRVEPRRPEPWPWPWPATITPKIVFALRASREKAAPTH